jgi:hypothetical protein
LLTGSETLTTIDNLHYVLTGISALTSAQGQYTVTVVAVGSGIMDLAGNPFAFDGIDQWVMDLTLPVLVDIVDVTPDPRNSSVGQVSITFSEAVFGLDRLHFMLQRDTGMGYSGNLLTPLQMLSTTDHITWQLSGLAGITQGAGTYLLTFSATGPAILDAAGNALAMGGTELWVTDTTPPTVDITDVTPDPSPTGPSSITIVFSESVTGVDLSDFMLRRNAGPNLLTASQALTTSDNIQYTLNNLGPLTSLLGEYELSLSAFGSQIVDGAGNLLVVGTFDSFRVGRLGDFDFSGTFDCADVNALTAVIAVGTHVPAFDLTGDHLVNTADLTQWLALAGAANLMSGNPYLPADANLDGIVDGSDFNIWNSHKFTFDTDFCSGNFNADNVIDGSDFNIWNNFKFNSSHDMLAWSIAWAIERDKKDERD